MKIIEEKVWFEFTCVACKSKCQAEPKDVEGDTNPDADGDTMQYTPCVVCPKCGKIRHIPERLVTEKLLKQANRRHAGSHRKHDEDDDD